jgi:hypothetical protein
MLTKGPAKKVTIFINEDTQHQMTALHDSIMTFLMHKGICDTHAPLVVAVHRHVTIPLARLWFRECGTDASVEHATQPRARWRGATARRGWAAVDKGRWTILS